jgi:photosystem II stability/assembly factor-like uncharacterized protein
LLGYSINGAPDWDSIVGLYVVNGRLIAYNYVRGDYIERPFRFASSTDGITWQDGGRASYTEMPADALPAGCGARTAFGAIRTAQGLLVDYYGLMPTGPAVYLYDSTVAGCPFVGSFPTGTAPGWVAPLTGSSNLYSLANPNIYGLGLTYSTDGKVWQPLPLPSLRPLIPDSLAQLSTGRVVLYGLHGPAPLLQVYGLDGSSPRDLLRNVRWQMNRSASYGVTTVVVGGGARDQPLSGISLRSTDGGASWQETSVFTHPPLLDVVADDSGNFVAVGVGGTLILSNDAGQTWKQRTSGTSQDLLAVAWGGGQFTAISSAGEILQSGNGLDWSLSTPIPQLQLVDVDRLQIGGLAFHDGRYVLAAMRRSRGDGSQLSPGLWESTDGKAWTAASTPGGPAFIGSAVTPCDGKVFVLGSIDAIPPNGGAMLAISDGRGKPWRSSPLPASLTPTATLACGQGQLVTASAPDQAYDSTYGVWRPNNLDAVFVSLDQGQTWTSGTVPFAVNAGQIQYFGGRYWLLGDADMLWRAP